MTALQRFLRIYTLVAGLVAAGFAGGAVWSWVAGQSLKAYLLAFFALTAVIMLYVTRRLIKRNLHR